MIGDDMKKNGFTLVELLAVMIILGIIATIFVPNTIKLLKENNLKIYKVKESELIKAAKDYANYDKNFSSPTVEIPIKYITMTQLVEGGYMNSILDTSSGKECRAFVKVTLNDINGYNYEACLLCDEYSTNKSFCSSTTYQGL